MPGGHSSHRRSRFSLVGVSPHLHCAAGAISLVLSTNLAAAPAAISLTRSVNLAKTPSPSPRKSAGLAFIFTHRPQGCARDTARFPWAIALSPPCQGANYFLSPAWAGGDIRLLRVISSFRAGYICLAAGYNRPSGPYCLKKNSHRKVDASKLRSPKF